MVVLRKRLEVAAEARNSSGSVAQAPGDLPGSDRLGLSPYGWKRWGMLGCYLVTLDDNLVFLSDSGFEAISCRHGIYSGTAWIFCRICKSCLEGIFGMSMFAGHMRGICSSWCSPWKQRHAQPTFQISTNIEKPSGHSACARRQKSAREPQRFTKQDVENCWGNRMNSSIEF